MTESNDTSENRVATDSSRVRLVLSEYLRRRARGEEVSEASLLEANPEIAGELQRELARFRLQQARRAARGNSGSGEPSDDTQTFAPSRVTVTCPHCHDITVCDRVAGPAIIECENCGNVFTVVPAASSYDVPRWIAHFELVERLGRGGFATVWKAKDTILDRYVALKIPRELGLDEGGAEQFLREARAAAQVHHPNIVRVHETGIEGNIPYIVTDLVEGCNLAEFVAETQLTFPESAELCRKLALALYEAHSLGIIHRDIKPQNILIGRDLEPYITDFGLARRQAAEITLTLDGDVLGTPAYMSPEQTRGESHTADGRTDIYSLGVILFVLITRELPFRGNARAIAHQVLNSETPSPKSLNPAIPRDLETICWKCLEKEPRLRYATAKELADDLQRFLHGEPIRAQPVTRAGRLYRWCRRQPAVAALSLSLLAVLAVGVVGVSRFAIRAAEGRANLYHRMVRQVQAGRMLTKEGYVARAWEDLKVARWVNTPELDLDMLRQEAVASLGDFRGYDPVTIESADRSITVCSLHPRGKFLAVGHSYGGIELRDPASGTEIASMPGRGASIVAISFAKDGSRLFFVDASRRVCECTVKADKLGREPLSATEIFQVDRDNVSFEFVLGGQYLVTYNAKSAALWDTDSRSAIARVEAPADRILRCVRVSPDGKWLAASCNTPVESASDRLVLWNAKTSEVEKEIALDRGHGYKKSLAFSNNSNFIAFGGEGLAVYRVPTLEPYLFYPGDAVMVVAFSPDDQLLSLVQIRGTVALWNMATNTKIASLSHPRAPNAPLHDESVVFSPDGRFLVSARAYSARVWNLRGAGERIVLPGHHGGVPTLTFAPDGNRLVSGSKDATVRMWDVNAGTMDHGPLTFSGPVQCLAISPDGRWLATGDWTSGGPSTPTLQVWNAGDFGNETSISHRLGNDKTNAINGVAFSPNGKYFAACGNGMQLWRVNPSDSGSEEIRLEDVAFCPGVTSLFVRFSPDSRFLAWADDWNNVRVWDVEAAKEIPIRAKMHYGWHGFAFVKDGLAFVAPDLSVEVWDVRRGVKKFSLGAPGEFQSPHIAATPDGDYLVGANTPDSVALWDVSARKKLFVFRPERSEIWSLAFDPAGTRLAVGLSDGGVAVWDLSVINSALAQLDLSWMTADEERPMR